MRFGTQATFLPSTLFHNDGTPVQLGVILHVSNFKTLDVGPLNKG